MLLKMRNLYYQSHTGFCGSDGLDLPGWPLNDTQIHPLPWTYFSDICLHLETYGQV